MSQNNDRPYEVAHLVARLAGVDTVGVDTAVNAIYAPGPT